jgi:hypothetical protein
MRQAMRRPARPQPLCSALLAAAWLCAASSSAAPKAEPATAQPDKLVVGMIRCNTSTGRVNDRALKRFCDTLRSRPDLDVLIAPEWFLVPKDGLHNTAEYRLIRRYLERKTEGSRTLVIPGTVAWATEKLHHNTALAVSDGKTVAAYAKQHAGGDDWFAYAFGKRWVPGKSKGVFRWNGLDVGLEICADHHAGTLRAFAGDKLDLQIIVSNGTRIFPEHAAVKPGGYVMICDGRADTEQAVKRRVGGQLVDVRQRQEAKAQGPFEVVTFELPLAR